jgi:hypothetical protein
MKPRNGARWSSSGPAEDCRVVADRENCGQGFSTGRCPVKRRSLHRSPSPATERASSRGAHSPELS